MEVYDPNIAPDPQQWLELDEQLRIVLAERHHRAERIKLPNVKAHAIFHAIVENQIAEGLEPVQRAMKRLTDDGLSRHDALHAIGSVLAEHLNEAMREDGKSYSQFPQEHYYAAVDRLTVKEWYQKYGSR